MEAMITNIRQDAGYYCGKAMQAFEKKNYIESIKNLNKAEKVAVGGERLEIYFILGLMYNCIEDYSRSSEYFLLSVLSRPLQSKAVRSMFDNAVLMKDVVSANNYKNLFNFTDATKEEKEALERIFEKLNKDLKPKIREVSIEDSEEFRENFVQALEMFEDEDFDGAIEILSKYDYKKSQDTRELMAECYFMSERTEKAVELLNLPEKTLLDNINLIVYLDDLGRKDESRDLISKIKNKSMTDTELFAFALSLWKCGEYVDCVETLERYLKLKPYDKNANNLYCSICIAAGLFSKAKEKLLQLKELAHFDAIYYLEMLNMCERKESKKTYDYLALWKAFDKKYKSRLKALLEFDEANFEKEIVKDYNFINWVATIKDKYLKNLFFAKAAKIRALREPLQKILVSNEIDKSVKQIIISTRLDMGYNEDFVVSRDGVAIGFVPLSIKHMKDKMLYKAYCLIINKLVDDSSQQWFFNLNYFFDNLNQICKEDIEDPYILAAIITWEFERFRNAKIKNICKYFNVKEEDFWKYYISDN